MNATTKHVVRYLGNDGDQYVRNRAGYLTESGDDRQSALMFDSILKANDFAWAMNRIFPGEFEVESFELIA